MVHRERPEDDPRRRSPDITRARETLDWEPTTPLREGLVKTVAYFETLLRDGPGAAGEKSKRTN